MTSRNPKTGGRIPPQGRTPSAPGVGKKARRHDLERPATPGLSDSDLQQGDVQRLEQAQSVAPRAGAKQVQRPSAGGAAAGQGQVAASGGLSVPGPVEFALSRLGGSLRNAPGVFEPAGVDPTPWMPFLRTLVSSGAGGRLTQAYVTQLSNMTNRPGGQQQVVVNMNELNEAVAQSLE